MKEQEPLFGILVHSHLRWDFVWQRPQHIVSRLSQSIPVLFLEDPLPLARWRGNAAAPDQAGD